jgi:hypothetical protein
MATKILVLDRTTGEQTWMFEIDAAEAVQRDPVRWQHTVKNPPPPHRVPMTSENW